MTYAAIALLLAAGAIRTRYVRLQLARGILRASSSLADRLLTSVEREGRQ